MWRARHVNIVIAFALTAARIVSAQPGVEPSGKNFHKIVSLDSIQFGLGASRDGRWLTIGTACSSTACGDAWGGEDGIWIMPSDGHAKPTRVLPAGHIDRSPAWFPSGDRLAFVSDRVSRDGSHKTYVMTVPIDPKTGRATAPPRQISTDETSFIGPVSPDGKWVPYIVKNAIKAVPANGGASRTLVDMEKAGPPVIWSRDGKMLYFVARGGPRLPPYGGVWYKVSVNGGPATRAYDNASAMPYAPNTDMHVVYVPRDAAEGRGIKRVELYDAKERMVGTIDLTTDMELFFPRGASGAAYAKTSNNRQESFLLTLEGGNTRKLGASQDVWVDGWVDNSTVTIEGYDSRGQYIATLDTAGHEGPHVTLPAGAGGCCGWQGVVGGAVTFWPATPAANRSDSTPIYIADARSGAIKELAADAFWSTRSFGRGGFYSDGDRFLVTTLNGQRLELRGITSDGRSTLLRSFPKSDSLMATSVHGDLVAWAIAAHDSLTIFSARGPTGRPHRLTAQGYKPGGFFEIAWSFDATMLAITGLSVGPPLSVIHVDESGAPRGGPVVLNARATQLWTMRWTPDNRSLVVTGIPAGARDEVVIRVPIDAKEAPTFYGRNDEWLFVSPDGKHIAYPAVRTLGTTIWRVDFLPPGSVGLSRTP